MGVVVVLFDGAGTIEALEQVGNIFGDLLKLKER